MSAEERILSLFESYWFERRVFASKPSLSSPLPLGEDEEVHDSKLNRTPTLIRKSYSDQFLSSKDVSLSDSSPKSVLGPHLQTILSGKEVESFDGSNSTKEEFKIKIHRMAEKNPNSVRDNRRRRKSWSSRSLSELEFDELKGFIDLGFVFSDEDKDSRLVSIIPGLQRLGKNEEELEETTSVSRPYLSEAWDCEGGGERVKNPLMDWRIPSFGNEMELKDHLRFWAHTVASTVR